MDDQHADDQHADEDVKDRYFKELCEQKMAYVDEALREYAGGLPRFHWAARVFGTLLILGGVALPSLVHLPDPYRTPAVSVVSFLVAALAALNSFYAWHHTWEQHTQASNRLRFLIANWEIGMIKASREQLDKAKAEAHDVTSYLFTKVFETVAGETAEAFEDYRRRLEGTTAGAEPTSAQRR